ncbi:M18 family aminopeptidase [Kocuria tytonicola]|uniref:M18 family aminopeptidase n=1 Tax=Kocuria tytonicola TaxID=2055946 RepID=UPI000EF965B7|nr:M18 family aminopeptidase [Kocuria tytonicola]RLZ02424.1 M18 family aminopeptidase [Kocuria tytonicola]
MTDSTDTTVPGDASTAAGTRSATTPSAATTPPGASAPDVPAHAAFARQLGEFVTASPSSYHAVAAAARELDAAGFTALSETAPWDELAPGRWYTVRDGALIAWVTPSGAAPGTGYRILGAHTDSPGFKLKPRPTTVTHRWYQAGVEVYGGALLNSWLDRDLRFAGRLVVRDGNGGTRELLTATGPVARIPQLAIHLDRSVNEALTLDRQRHVQPVWGVGDAQDADVLAVLAEATLAPVAGSGSANPTRETPSTWETAASGKNSTAQDVGTTGANPVSGSLDPADILGYDITVADTQAPELIGAQQNLLASGRLDNLTSVFAGLRAMVEHAEELESARQISVLAAFDHEEVGSATRSGAGGPFLEDVLVRIGAALGESRDDQLRALANSVCLSSDAGHLVHPNYQGHHDPVNTPEPGRGPLLKINAQQRYTTDSVGAALWAQACERAGVPYQEFVSNNTVPCGSTIGPITATRLGIRTLDVGVGLLSMHSARELVHTADLHALRGAIGGFWRA